MAFLSVGGGRIEVERIPAGLPGRPALVFLHEGLGSVAMWRDFPARVAHACGCDAVIYSRHGYGRSAPLEGPRGVRYMHDEALVALPDVLRAAGVVRPVLVGHSDGGSIALIHAGAEYIGAPLGTDVVSTNDGIVRLTFDHIFSGKGVFVDHGLGFYSMYFHLSEVLVKDGDLVKAGQVVGKVGATGRATGPHLHWGVKLNGARVNPYALLDLPFTGAVQSATPAPVTEPTSGAGSPAQ